MLLFIMVSVIMVSVVTLDVTLFIVMLSVVMLNLVMGSVVYAECRGTIIQDLRLAGQTKCHLQITRENSLIMGNPSLAAS
jgi:hypothetical protein